MTNQMLMFELMNYGNLVWLGNCTYWDNSGLATTLHENSDKLVAT